MARRGGANFGNRSSNLPGNFGAFGDHQSIGPLLQPPPLYPTTDKKPAETECDVDMEYLLLMDRVFIDHFNDLTSDLFDSQSKGDKMECFWACMPKELQPKVKAKLVVVKTNITNADQELDRLERLEKKLNNENDDDDVVADHTEEVDEEMDDGTDYNIDYFDNGEMDEENDDGDGGPVY